MSHVQALINIQSNFDERAANGHRASIAILNSVIHGLIEGLRSAQFAAQARDSLEQAA